MSPLTPEQGEQETADLVQPRGADVRAVVPFFTGPGRRLVELAEVGPGMTVLDVGVGRGAVTVAAPR